MASIFRKRVYRVISDVLDVPVTVINDDSSPDTIGNWNSLSHLNLILALEAEFNVALSDEDTMDMLSVKLIQMILVEREATDST
jgi:acyl carrier protein